MRSPSPAPQPPVALTPGPRAAAFTTLYDKTLKKSLEKISYDNFAACFPTIAAQVPGSLATMHKGFVGRLDGLARVWPTLSLIEAHV
jgi:kinetochore protein NNF1